MDTETRIEAAKARLGANMAVLLRAKEAGPPCVKCRYFVPQKDGGPYGKKEGPFCAHLAYTEQQFSVVSGQVVEEIQVPTELARDAEGLCGFEAVLFEPKNPPLSLIRRVGKTTLAAVAIGYLWLLSGFIFWQLVGESLK